METEILTEEDLKNLLNGERLLCGNVVLRKETEQERAKRVEIFKQWMSKDVKFVRLQ